MPGATSTPAPTPAPLLPPLSFLPAAPRQRAPVSPVEAPPRLASPYVVLVTHSGTAGKRTRGRWRWSPGLSHRRAACAVPRPRCRTASAPAAGAAQSPAGRPDHPCFSQRKGQALGRYFHHPPPPPPHVPPILLPLCQQQLRLPMRSPRRGPAEPWRTRCTRRRAAPARPQPPQAGFGPAAGRAESSGVH